MERNDESLYDSGNGFPGAIILPDWSNAQTTQRLRKPKLWCQSCQCEHPWPKDGYTFHVRSRRANAYLRSLQLSGDVPSIDPMSVEPLEEVTQCRASEDAHKMGMELLKRLRGKLPSDNSGSCSFNLLLGILQAHPGYASFRTPSNAEEFLRSAEGSDPTTKWHEFLELIYQQHRDSSPAYYTAHTGGVPRYFYQRFPLLAEQAKWAYGDRTSDNEVSSDAPARLNGRNQDNTNQAVSHRGNGRRRHSKRQRRAVMKANENGE